MDEMVLPGGWAAEPDLHVAKIQLRSDRGVAGRLERALALAPPDRPNFETRRPGLACASLAPDEWLLTGPADEIERALEAVRDAFAGDLCLCVDLTAGRFVSRFSGAGAVAFLARHSPLDTDPVRFPPGSAARTPLDDIGLFVTRLDGDRPGYRLIVDQSFAGYLRHLLSLSSASH